MGRRGPAPEPTRLKLIKGTKPYRINTNEPVPLDRAINRPEWLSTLASEEWDRIAPHLVAMGTVTDADLSGFAIYCEAVARWRRLAELVAASPPVVNRDGAVVKNPVYAQVRDAAAEVRLWAREFGLTPSARAGIRVEHVIGGEGGARLLTGG
jgi:P27 family predicted phage terminase small subunit